MHRKNNLKLNGTNKPIKPKFLKKNKQTQLEKEQTETKVGI